MNPETLAALHATCFQDAPRAWSAAEFATLLAQPEVFLVAGEDGFALGRVAGPEAELMTLAVAPAARRRGRGRALLNAFEREAILRGASEAFLEVAVENAAAGALYGAAGWVRAGLRPGYYGTGAARSDALVLRKCLEASGAT
jgi:ribosomal-protein-alanine N-acetyltransferase